MDQTKTLSIEEGRELSDKINTILKKHSTKRTRKQLFPWADPLTLYIANVEMDRTHNMLANENNRNAIRKIPELVKLLGEYGFDIE